MSRENGDIEERSGMALLWRWALVSVVLGGIAFAASTSGRGSRARWA